MNRGRDTDRWVIPKFARASEEAISLFTLIKGRIIREHKLTMNLFRIDAIHSYRGQVTLLHVYARQRETKIYVEVSVEKNNSIDFYHCLGQTRSQVQGRPKSSPGHPWSD